MKIVNRRDLEFVLFELLDAEALTARPRFADHSRETFLAALDTAEAIAAEKFASHNRKADEHEPQFDGLRVSMIPEVKEALKAFIDAGFMAAAHDYELGGMQLPVTMTQACFSLFKGANVSTSGYPFLTIGNANVIRRFGSPAQQEKYLKPLLAGRFFGTMALTEPQAGSSLSDLATRAEPNPDGSYSIVGNKIFISGGDHDLTDNIVHLVLCRLPEAPPGTKGLSLALVPKVLPDGSRNSMTADGIEHKMGIHGSATCAMRYEGATGWLLGEPHRGLAAMFVMMNAARLAVAVQGLGHLDMATQNARRYAAERQQFRAPIAQQPAMRRTLLNGQAMAEGLRVVVYRAAMRLDEAERHPDAARRAAAAAEASILTPVLKAFGSQQGFQGASDALQVFGGYGYVAETGVEQTLRDARIAMIYEGTNEIQAIDLLQRKLLGREAEAFAALLSELRNEAEGAGDDGRPLATQIDAAQHAMAMVRDRAARDAEAPLRVADDFLAGVAYLLMAWAWTASLRAAKRCMAGDLAPAERATVARHGLDWLLPQSAVHWQRVNAALPLGRVGA